MVGDGVLDDFSLFRPQKTFRFSHAATSGGAAVGVARPQAVARLHPTSFVAG